jgi:hypothetical protein
MVFAGEAGLIESLARPGGNVTGTTSYSNRDGDGLPVTTVIAL